jgi:1-acyl-sn-glycerol-3-phosphate acyltransferase
MPDRSVAAGRAVERVIRLPLRMAARGVLDLETSGKQHVPAHGPLVVAANHFSHLDVPILETSLDRYVRFLAVDELYGRSRAFDATLALFGAIPLDRDGYPVAALRTALDHLSEGNAIGVFPEGRRVEMWGVDAPKRGAAWLAFATGAPLLTVAIYGTQDSLAPRNRGFTRTAVRMWIDEPLMWYDYVDRTFPLQSMMDDWYEVVNDHLEPWGHLERPR